MRVSVFLVLLLAAVSVAGASYVVPEGLKFTIFAQGSEPAAQIVVGANAPSITDDSSSAMIIRRAIERKEVVIAGGNITYKKDKKVTLIDAVSEEVISTSKTDVAVSNILDRYIRLKFGGKEVMLAGKYNRIVPYVGPPYTVALVYEPLPDSEYFLGDPDPFAPGRVYEIGGKKYAVVSTNGEDEVSLAPAILRKTDAFDTFDPDFSTTILGDLKYVYVSNGGVRRLYLLKGDEYLGIVDASQIPGGTGEIPRDALPDEFRGLRMFADMRSDTLVLVVVDRDDVFTIANREENVLGYERVYVGVSSAPSGFSYPRKPGIFFKGEEVALNPEGDTEIPGESEYVFELDSTGSGKVFRVWKIGVEQKFDGGITVSGAGSVKLPMPSLEIVTEQEANKSMNLVLIGGPEANELVNELVMSGMSTVDWYSSEGDIEVIENAFGTGSYAVIVAGKDREATRKAAKMLAELLSL